MTNRAVVFQDVALTGAQCLEPGTYRRTDATLGSNGDTSAAHHHD